MAPMRKLLAGDAARIRDHLLRLDRQSRYERFSGYVSDAFVERYCERINWIDDILIGWVEGGELRALAQLVRLPYRWPREAELALTVEPDWQDRGIGSELCREILLSARNRMIGRVCMLCLMENVRMRRIVRRLEGKLVYLDGAAEGEVRLPPPNYLSLWQEAFDEGGALVETLVDQWRPASRRSLRPPRRRKRVRARAPRPAA
ncbi:MAG: GNAT family N-acetyltransferase [Kiloniellales bacterium]|nr:GNAT family N-acetyltransferase [Kiloniellales bacterium]